MEIFRDWGAFVESIGLYGWYIAALLVWEFKTEPPSWKRNLYLLAVVLLVPIFYVLWLYFQVDKWRSHPPIWALININALFFGVLLAHGLGYKTWRKGKKPMPRLLNLLLFREADPELRFWKAWGATVTFLVPVALLLGIGYTAWGAQPCGWFDRWVGYSGCLFTLNTEDSISYHAFSADGKLMAVTGGRFDSPSIGLYSATDGSPVRKLTNLKDSIYNMTFSSDGQLLATFSYKKSDKMVTVWQTDDGKLLQTLSLPDVEDFSSNDFLQFSPDGQLLLSRTADGLVRIWRVSDWQEVKTFPKGSYVTFSPDGLAIVTTRTGLQYLDPSTWTEVRHLDILLAATPTLSPDGHLLAVSSPTNDDLMVYSLPNGKLLYTLPNGTIHLAFSPDGRYLLRVQQGDEESNSSADNSYRLQLWDLSNGKLARELDRYYYSYNNKPVFSPDGKMAWSISHDVYVYKAP